MRFEQATQEEKELAGVSLKDELLKGSLVTEISLEKDHTGKALGDDEIEMIGSTSATDRDGESIDPKGWDLKNFKKNPIILPQHNYSKPPIGKAVSVKVVDGKLMFKIKFPEEGVNPEADTYRKLYKAGFMNSSSVGFIPKKWIDGDGKKSPFRTFTNVELLELSLVSVPSNPTALLTAKSKGVVSDEELKAIGQDVEEEIEKSTDPNLILNDEHEKQHIAIMQFMANVDKRLAFIDGYIAGQSKQATLEETDEARTMEVDSYVKELLCGKVEAISTDKPSTDKVDLKGILLKKTLKQQLKGE